MLLYFLIISLLLLIAYQDFKYRYINVWPLVFLMSFALTLGIQSIGLVAVVKNALINGAFIGLQLLGVSLYFSIKAKRLINITSEQIGWGDILFFLPLTCLLGFEWFVFFYISSLILILIFYLILKMTFVLKNETIPLAGGQALCLIVLGLAKWLIGFNLYGKLTLLS